MRKQVLSIVLSAAMASSMLAGAAVAQAEETGKVYLLNFKPETDEAWQDLAAAYTDETGVPVTVLTAAAGTYNDTLKSEMAKNEAPTIFNVGNTAAAQTWDEYTLDLSDSELYNHLTDKSLVVNYNDKVAAVANCYECYGIIYNKQHSGRLLHTGRRSDRFSG